MVEISQKTKQFNAKILEDLISLGKSLGYKNPHCWALKIIESRSKKIKSKKKQEVKNGKNI